MFSIQALMGSDNRFFDFFEAASRETLACATYTISFSKADHTPDGLFLVRQARINCKQLTTQASELAVKTFVTIIDREDIEALATAIYRISKPIEKFAERLSVLRKVFQGSRVFTQLNTIERAAKIVLTMTESLRQGINAERVQRLNIELQGIEDQADILELELLEDLYLNTKNPIEVIAVRDLFDLAEKAVDRCRDTGNLIVHICHKNS